MPFILPYVLASSLLQVNNDAISLPRESQRFMCCGLYQSRYINLTDLYAPNRRLQDHERVERCDAAIAAHAPSRVGRAAGARNPEYRSGGDLLPDHEVF